MKNSIFISFLFFGLSFFAINSLYAESGNMICTREYMPVCGQPPMPSCPIGMGCIQVMPQPVTYGNNCTMLAAGATLIEQGACEDSSTGILVGNDVDEHGCKASAGYSYDPMMERCIRPWEKSQDLINWAHTSELTKYNTVEEFGFDRTISRQEAAAILARAGEKLFGLRYASYPDICNIAYKDESIFDASLKNDIYTACAFDMMHGNNGYFSPLNSLSRAEALVTIMRALDGGKKDESKASAWYLPYADRAHELGIFSFANFKGFEEGITRGELIEWLYKANTYVKNKIPTGNKDMVGKWTLTRFNTTEFTNQSGSENGGYVLTFENDTMNTRFCNSLFGSYSLSGDMFYAPTIASTMMYCEGISMTLEDAFQLDNATYTIRSLTPVLPSREPTLELILTTKKGNIFRYVR